MKVVFDCDNTMGLRFREIDDGLALLYLLGRPDVELCGVTTTFGNGSISEVFGQTVPLLHRHTAGRVPVLRGAAQAGDMNTEAAAFLAETAAATPGEVTVVATGPLGNLLGAAELDPSFFPNLRGVVCMGGVRRPLRVGWRRVRELNLSCDPAAAAAVLRAPCPVTLMDAHVCLQAPFGWGDLWRARFWDRNQRRLVRDWLVSFGLWSGAGVFYLWDLLPAVFVSHPELFDKARARLVASAHALQAGQLIRVGGDAGTEVHSPSRIRDIQRFMAILYEAWQRTARSEVSHTSSPSSADGG